MDDILDASFDGILISDAEANVIKVNKAYEKLSGISREEVLGRNLKDIIDDGVVKSAVVFEVTKSRVPTSMIHRYPRTGKSATVTGCPVFNRNGRLIYVVANFRDTTELSRINKKLGLNYNSELNKEIIYLEAELAKQSDQGFLIKNPIMKECLRQATKVAQYDLPVMLLGESGTGKTKLAEIIHKSSQRANNSFISINCGSIPETLLESEMFGYEKGAFTGASARGKTGLFETATGGTLFLDEIGELPISLQVKLLKAIEEKKIRKVGATKPIDIDVRIITATNRDLESMLDTQNFRCDLFFRLNVVPLIIPPLRARKDEIPLLVKHFFNQFNSQYNIQKYPHENLISGLCKHEYPGNVRELKNIIERLIVLAPDNLITAEHLQSFSLNFENTFQEAQLNGKRTLADFMDACEKRALLKALEEGGSPGRVAKRLGISGATLWRKLSKHGLKQKKMIVHDNMPKL